MNTTELIELLKTQDLTDDEAYNILIADLYERVPAAEVEQAQRLVAYFMYKFTSVCLPAIRGLKTK